MVLAVISGNKIKKNLLPEIKNGNYQIIDGNHNILGNVVATNNVWIFYASDDYEFFFNGETKYQITIEEFSQIEIKKRITHESLIIFSYPIMCENQIELQTKTTKISIGKNPTCDITYTSPYIKDNHAQLTYMNNRWYLECMDDYAYVNDRLVKKKRIDHGDIIFIFGLKIFCVSNIVIVTNLIKTNQIGVKKESFDSTKILAQEINSNIMTLESEQELYNANDEFNRAPRFRTTNEKVEVKIAPPPQEQTQNTPPTLLTIGPQLTMMLTAIVNMMNTLTQVVSGATTLDRVLPSLILSIITMVSSFMWPALTRRWNKRNKKRNELQRIKTYRSYLKRKDKEISEIIANQKQILLENNNSLEECQQIIYQKKRNLWERQISDNDFLQIRLGTGFVKPDILIKYEEAEFQIKDNMLEDELKELIKKYDYLEEAPLNTSLVENRLTAVVGNQGLLKMFFETIILQILTFHLFSELKIIVFTDENNADSWDYLKFAPHCWDNQKEFRFIGATMEEKKKISSYLENTIKSRKEAVYGENGKSASSSDGDLYKQFNQYYLIIIDRYENVKNIEAISEILNLSDNLGFSILIKNSRITNLPSQCSTFINISEEKSGLFKNNLTESNQKQFDADFNKTVDIAACVQKMANIYVNIPKEKHELPKSIGFLEMYGIGNVEQFNSLDRWKNNNPVNSLAVPIGIDQSGELFYMDIHEKAYGPHGLVAGTTGSGKSEWIITYILSLCVNFSPLEVQFVLIDYKGGGLAGSFVNEETGMRLPHLVGTITNLDKSEIRRSLASLEAESKRRQRKFNEAREKLNDSSMNIYKYQQYYRKGMLDEPLSHLFIISDEFAELKSQEPEFLDQLVSIARIGRSLGIHLILATQKPAGVVNEQMWSNSRFKVCLRVQDKADSNDMIKCPDAAFLKQTGAFYLQVGLNEVFTLGQSAYAGGLYKPTTIVKKRIDTAVEILSRDGSVIDTIEEKKEEASTIAAHGEELLNIILYVMNVSKSQNYNPRRLWLDAIPEKIYIDMLKSKYSFNRIPFEINPIIGEYDNPYQQTQELLRLNINKGNVFLTGLSGAGKENLIQSMIYAIITNYTPQEISIYIADFGAETLAMYENAPHIGSIVYQNNKEKMENLIRFAKKEYKSRRKRYREFGGSYESYIKYSPKKDNIMLIIINSIDVLKENDMDMFDDISSIFSECAKYGIVFLASSTDKNVFRNKIREAFPQTICLRLTDEDYAGVLGTKAKGIKPKDLKGRGLIEVNGDVYEFQSASIYQDDKLQQVVKSICNKLTEAYKFKVKGIPMIPKTINLPKINTSDLSLSKICVGYRTETIEPYYINLQKNFGTLVIAPKKSSLSEFAKVMYGELEKVANDATRVYLFDTEDLFKSERYTNIKYVNSEEIVNTFNNLNIYIKSEVEKYNKMENKGDYKAPRRSLIVLHSAALMTKQLGRELYNELEKIVDSSRELQLFDFLILDVLSNYKDIGRDKAFQKICLDSNGIFIANTYDGQMFIEINSRDIKTRDALPENMGYIVENGKGYLAQVLQYTEVEEEEEE